MATDTLRGKIAVVTGSSRGMGVGIARAFAREGATVVLNYPSWEPAPDAAIAAVSEVGTRPIAIQADVSSTAGAALLIDRALQAHGRLDVLVNNVGQHVPAVSLQQSEQEWDTQMQVNLRSAFLCSQQAARVMKDAGGGAIVCVASKMGLVGAPGNAAYCCAKAGVIMLVKVLATEWAPLGIRVNAVAPGATNRDAHGAEIEPKALTQPYVPLGRRGTSAEIAAAVAFLASDQASYITGQVLCVDGGATAQLSPKGIFI